MHRALIKAGAGPVPLSAGTEVGEGIKIIYDPGTAMECTVRAAPSGQGIILHGDNRAPADWFGVELDLHTATQAVRITCRNYPAERLFPRLFYDRGDEKGLAVDLPDVAASVQIAERVLEARLWAGDARFASAPADALRLALFVPSSVWFAMEIRAITVQVADA
ncbi:MAG: hypothetical protein AAF557_24085 [Pseudomonadota bacterium]